MNGSLICVNCSDLNGKKFAWQGVALLPFVDERRLHSALESVYPLLTPGGEFINLTQG
jgi:5'-3' exonuclease